MVVVSTLWGMRTLAIGAFAVWTAAACGNSGGGTPTPAPDDGGKSPVAYVPREVPLGMRDLTGFAYSRGPGRKTFRAALDAAKGERWPEVETLCRNVLATDAGHLEAHWLLAKALSSQGRFAEVGDPLSAAVAGDWLRWGPLALDDEVLAGFRDSAHFGPFRELVERYREQMRRTARDGAWFVGRRGKAWRPEKSGATSINHRSEIYAYDAAGKRYVRVSRTNGSLVGVLPSPAANEAAYVAYRQVWLPTDEEAAAGKGAFIRRAVVGTIDADGPRMSAREVVFEDVWAVELLYATELPASVGAGASASRPALVARVWKVNKGGARSRKPSTYLLKAESGSAEKIAPVTGPWEFLRVTFDRVSHHRPRVEGIGADWDQRGAAGAFVLDKSRKTITMPDGESAARDTMRWSAQGMWLAFAIQPADPCSTDAADRATVLYIADAATGKLREVARGSHDFAPVWLDEAQLAYVDWADDAPGVRVYDAEAGGPSYVLDTVGGLGTHWLPARSLCAGDAEPAGLDKDSDAGFDEEWDDDDGLAAPDGTKRGV